jgi:hypothetical protein
VESDTERVDSCTKGVESDTERVDYSCTADDDEADKLVWLSELWATSQGGETSKYTIAHNPS